MTRARSQAAHRAINAKEYPGTRQLCAVCGRETERCEEDALYAVDGRGPLCWCCFRDSEEADNAT